MQPRAGWPPDLLEHASVQRERARPRRSEHAMRRRISERFPGMLMNHSLHLPSGGCDACYSFTISLPGATNDRTLWFQVSFLAPYYIIHRSCTTNIVKEPRTDFFLVTFQGVHFHVSRSLFDPKLIASLD